MSAIEHAPVGQDVPPAGGWRLDPDHTAIEFVSRHLFTKVRGRFTRFTGQVQVAENPLDSKVEVVIEAASVTSDSTGRDEHLRSADFFDVERFSELRFTSTKVEPVDGATWKLHGDLIIRDITRPVVLTFEYLGLVTDPWGQEKVNFSASTEVNREEWGLTWNAALETGGVLVSKNVRLEFEVQASRA